MYTRHFYTKFILSGASRQSIRSSHLELITARLTIIITLLPDDKLGVCVFIIFKWSYLRWIYKTNIAVALSYSTVMSGQEMRKLNKWLWTNMGDNSVLSGFQENGWIIMIVWLSNARLTGY